MAFGFADKPTQSNFSGGIQSFSLYLIIGRLNKENNKFEKKFRLEIHSE